MKLTITIPDTQYEKLEDIAKAQGKLPAQFVADAMDFTMQHNPKENQILLRGTELSDIGLVTGGKTFRNAAEIVRYVQDLAKVSVDGISFQLEGEDLHALHQQYTSFDKFITFEEFVKQNVNEALSQYLWGSTRGAITWK